MSGEVERAALPGLLGVSDRQARKLTAELLAVAALQSDTKRAPLRLSFPARLAGDWMPVPFPEWQAATDGVPAYVGTIDHGWPAT